MIDNLALLLIIGVVAMLLLAIGVIFFVVLYQKRVIRHQQELKRIQEEKQRELMQASIRGEEDERMRIAAELHDDVGATLSSVRLYLHAAGEKDADGSVLKQGKELLDDSIKKVRSISHRLQPAMLQQLGLQASLESFANMMDKAGQVHMSCKTTTPIPRLKDTIELGVYRIVQELTNNILKHAHATEINIELKLHEGLMQATLQHNGEGLTDELYETNLNKKGAIGLKNILNRLKAIRATISFSKGTDGLYYIIIQAPVS